MNDKIMENLDQTLNYEPNDVRRLFCDLVEAVLEEYEQSREKSLVITKLEEASMWLARADLDDEGSET